MQTENSRFILDEGGAVVGHGDAEFSVRRIARTEANAVIRERHYSGTVCATSFVHLGVFGPGPEPLGVLQFGPAMNPASAGAVVAGTEKDEYLELNRMWLSDALPRNSESRALSGAMRVIRQVWPRVGWVQSFADERCGGLGVVYQASNFVYCGEHMARFWKLDNEWYHNIHATRRTNPGRRGEHLQANLARAEKHEFRQFRYLYFIKRRFLRALRYKIQPFPKRKGA